MLSRPAAVVVAVLVSVGGPALASVDPPPGAGAVPVPAGTAGAGQPPSSQGPPSSPDPVGTWPLAGTPEVVRGFDPPETRWGSGHRGVDLLARPGAAVLASLPGRVTWAGPLAGRGVVVVDHGSTRTTYEPVRPAVRVGESVAGGAVLGRLDLALGHCRPRACLHWGWLRGEAYLDPLRLVGAGPVRLLPLWRPDPVATVPPGLAGTGAPAGPPLPVRPAGGPAGTPGAAGPW